MKPGLFHRWHFAQLRRVLYENTGIDFGLCSDIDDLGKKIRAQASLIGELSEEHFLNRKTFTTHPSPNWAHATPVQGRTKVRTQTELQTPTFESQQVKGTIVSFTGEHEGTLTVNFCAEHEGFLCMWIGLLNQGAKHAQKPANLYYGGKHYQMVCWPLRYTERGVVLFRYVECTSE